VRAAIRCEVYRPALLKRLGDAVATVAFGMASAAVLNSALRAMR
jgi:hypothetical protein